MTLSTSSISMTLKWLIPIFMLTGSCLRAQEKIKYKSVGTDHLYLTVYNSELDTDTPSPAILFYFGGGWKGGSIVQFHPHAEYFSKRGFTCFLVDYRTKSSHGTTPFASLMDAKTAIRYVRKNANKLNINPNRIVALGGSAGGHLAAALAYPSTIQDSNDEISISTKPDALILFNPVIDNSPAGYGYERIGKAYKEFSPLHNLDHNFPPTLFFLGDQDGLVPVSTARYFTESLKNLDIYTKLIIYEGAKHGFFNYKFFDNYSSTLRQADEFLISLNLINKKPLITIE